MSCDLECELAAGEGLRVAARRLHPAKSHEPAKELVVEPVLAVLARIVVAENPKLLLDQRLAKRDEDVWRPETTLGLGDLVLEDEVVAKRVPGELAGEPVILVEIAAGVGEDEVRLNVLQLLEDLLDLTADVREEAIAKLVNPNIRPACVREKRLCARTCFGG